MLFNEVKEKLLNTKIVLGQLDPNGVCNAGCWYCPVRYEKNPKEYAVTMPLDLLERVLQQVRNSKFVAERMDFFYTAHYNEILLYKHFEEMLGLFRKYGFKTMVLSNGTPLGKDKIDLIEQNRDVILGVCLNIPASNATDWANFSGFSPQAFDIVVRNVDYAFQKLGAGVSIQVNGLQGNYNIGQSLGKSLVAGRLENVIEQVNGWKELIPGINAYPLVGLSDRAGLLSELDVLTQNTPPLASDEEVHGCSHFMNGGDRISGTIHINARGDLFLCCADFAMDHQFGNLADSELDDLWASDDHVNMILNAFKTICSTCSSRITRKK
jgi:sulfatase maturation enzyme AslB (radical SAM superfamily)